MQTQTYSKNKLHKFGSHLFNAGMLAGLATLTFGLVSCGGGGGATTTTSTGNTTPTITSITPAGIVASSVPKTLSILGTNFISGMTVSVTDSIGGAYTVSPASVTSSTVLTTNVTIPTTPADSYVTVAVKSSTGTMLATAVLGVAGTTQTLASGIQTIFTNKCATCHTNGAAGSMNLDNATSGDATGVIGIPSVGCSPKLRVVPGDPRRASSVLIDKIKATSSSHACSGTPMPASGILTAQEITDIVDWVAGGAN